MADPPYVFLGCYVDNGSNRTLPVASLPANDSMNASVCHDYCNTLENQAVYFGLEYSTECYCGVKRDADNSTFQLAGSPRDCDMPCKTSTTGEICGGNWRLSLYRILDPVPVDATSLGGSLLPGATASSTGPSGSESVPGTPSNTGPAEYGTQGGGSPSLSGGAIAGITVAALLGMALLALVVMFLVRQRQKWGTTGRRVTRAGAADPQAEAGGSGGSGTEPQMAAVGGATSGATAAAGSSNHSREGAVGTAVGGSNSKAKVSHREGEVGGSARGGTASVDGDSLVAGAPYHHQVHNDELPGYQSSAR